MNDELIKDKLETHGKCCECVDFHHSNGNLVSCMRAIAIESK